MNDCLITNLKKSFSDSALRKINEIPFELKAFPNVINITVYTGVGDGIKARLLGNAYFTTAEGNVNLGKESEGSSPLYIKADEDCTLFVSSRYTFSGIYSSSKSNFSVNVDDLLYSAVTIVDLDIQDCSLVGDINKLNGKIQKTAKFNAKYATGDLTSFLLALNEKSKEQEKNVNVYIYGGDLSVNLSSLNGANKLNILTLPNVYGDFSYLGTTASNDIYFRPNTYSGLYGTIEGFVSKAIASGRSTGKVKIAYPETYNITFEGILIADNSNVVKGELSYFKWDSSGNITWTKS